MTGTKIRFENHHKQLKAPYIIYADFESIIPKIEGPALDPCQSNTQQTVRHEACGYSYMVVRSDGQTQPLQLYRGPDAAKHFLAALQVEEGKIKAVLANSGPMHMTPEDHKSHVNATDCHVCNKALNGDSVRDQCHITDTY